MLHCVCVSVLVIENGTVPSDARGTIPVDASVRDGAWSAAGGCAVGDFGIARPSRVA